MQRLLARQKPQPAGKAVQVRHVGRRLHGSGAVRQAPASRIQSPLAHIPPVGPVAVPARHRLLARHHPQALLAAQRSHAVSIAHGSGGGGHDDVKKFHASPEHSPRAGPEVVPVTQRLIPRHQPHPSRDAQSAQPLLLRHGSTMGTSGVASGPASGGAMHADGTQAQSVPGQLRSSGPEEVPMRQRPAVRHQPQEPIGVQVPQELAMQGPASATAVSGGGGVVSAVPVSRPPSVGPMHIPVVQAQVSPMQRPSVDPVAVPARHALAVRHHPQPDRAAQSSQRALVPHEAAVSVATSGGGSTGAAHVWWRQKPAGHSARVGPAAVPSTHTPVAAQNPQDASALHEAQSRKARHGSVGGASGPRSVAASGGGGAPLSLTTGGGSVPTPPTEQPQRAPRSPSTSPEVQARMLCLECSMSAKPPPRPLQSFGPVSR